MSFSQPQPQLPPSAALIPNLQWLTLPKWGGQVCLVRMDQLPYGGGNKVTRLLAWLKAKAWPTEVVAMSDAGSHSFLTLLRLLESGEFGLKKLTLLSRGQAQTSHAKHIQLQLFKHPQVSVITGSTAKLWLRFVCFKLKGFAVLPIGGATQAGYALDQAMFAAVSHAIESRAAIAATSTSNNISPRNKAAALPVPNVMHVLPVASGVLLRAFCLAAKDAGNQDPGSSCVLQGVYTATAPMMFYQWQKFRLRRITYLLPAPNSTSEQYLALQQGFMKDTGVLLDPVHMLPCVAWLEQHISLSKAGESPSTLIIWITGPSIS